MNSTQRSRVLALSLLISLAAIAPAAWAVRLDSSGSNDEYIGLANFAFSYASVPYTMVTSCYLAGARDSSWEIPVQCASSGDPCWATVSGTTVEQGSMRKALLHYYAKNHKDSGQGYCDIAIGTTSFQINFDYQDTGTDFSLSLIPIAGAGYASTCPTREFSPTDPALTQQFYENTDVNDSSNLICNDDFVISLAADPEVSNGAMVTVVNNLYGLSQAVQEAPTTTAVQVVQVAALGSKSASAAATARRRLSNRITEQGRWLVVSDSEGNRFDGILVSGDNDSTTADEAEIVLCRKSGDDGNPDPVMANYDYDCSLQSLDGTSARTASYTLPGTQLRALPLLTPPPAGPVSAVRSGVVGLVRTAVQRLSKTARLGSLDEEGSLVWHGTTDQNVRVVMFQHGDDKALEMVTHASEAASPSFMSCSQQSLDERNMTHVCQANLRCAGGPCLSETWSAPSEVEFPLALFKPRPCPAGQGVPATNPSLKLKKLGERAGDARLVFESGYVPSAGNGALRPDQTGFRLLVEDAQGNTVVDLDIPPTEPNSGEGTHRRRGGRDDDDDRHKGGRRNGWRVDDDGEEFRFRSRESIGGAVPRVEIERIDDDSEEWRIRVRGREGMFDGDDLELPLTARFTFEPQDPNSNQCAAADFEATASGAGCIERNDGEVIRCR